MAIALAIALPAPDIAGAQHGALDRIVAVVDGRPITQSDVTAATRFGLVGAVPPDERSRGVLDALINRDLILAEVRRFQPPEPPVEQVRERAARVRERFATPEEFSQALAAAATTETRLEGFFRDSLLVEAYIAQRFASPTIPTEGELVRYYRDHEQQFARAGTIAPFDEVREAVRLRFLDEQRERLVANWLTGLQQRADIVVFEAAGR